MASSSSCSLTSRGRAVMGLGNGLWTAVGNTYATCSSELVLWAISAAVVRARAASLEPSVASRIFVGNMLICSLLLDGFPYLVFRIDRHKHKSARVVLVSTRATRADS